MSVEYAAIRPDSASWERLRDLAALTAGEQMIVLDKQKSYNNQLATVAVNSERDIIGYMAQTATYDDGIVEVGSLIVHPYYRKTGVLRVENVSAELVRRTTKRVIMSGAQKILAFCNPRSGPVFEGRGFKHVSLSQVPNVALFSCYECPKKCSFPGQACCDKAYIFASPVLRSDKVELE